MRTLDNYFYELETALGKLSFEERAEALRFYREFASDAEIYTYADMEQRFGSPKNLASSILADAAIKTASQNRKGSIFKALSIAFASLLALPFSLPVIFALVIPVIAIFFALAVIVFAVGVTVFALAATAVGLLIGSFTFLVPFAPFLFLKSIVGAVVLFAIALLPCVLVFFGARWLFKKAAVTISNYTKRRSRIE